MKKVLLVARQMIPSVLLCGHAQLTELARRGRLVYRRTAPAGCTAARIAWADVLVFVRADDPFSLSAARLARRAGKTCVCVLDDDLLCVPAGLESAAHYALPETRRCLRGVMDQCQILLSPSAALLSKYGSGFARAERIEEPAFPACPAPPAAAGPVRIGFAGSVDRAGDVDALLIGALQRVKERFGSGVSIEFFGPRPAAARRLGAVCYPYLDSYGEYRRAMETLGWEIGLAPLPDTPFHRCKHYNKYIEYAAFGIAGIYSDTEPYRAAVRHGENGLLAANTEDAWFRAISRLIEDEPLRRRIGCRCLAEARDRYSVSEVARVWEEIIEAAPASPAFAPELWLLWGALSVRSWASGARRLVSRALRLPFRRWEGRA